MPLKTPFSPLDRMENHIKWFEHYLDFNGITKGGLRAGVLPLGLPAEAKA